MTHLNSIHVWWNVHWCTFQCSVHDLIYIGINSVKCSLPQLKKYTACSLRGLDWRVFHRVGKVVRWRYRYYSPYLLILVVRKKWLSPTTRFGSSEDLINRFKNINEFWQSVTHVSIQSTSYLILVLLVTGWI